MTVVRTSQGAARLRWAIAVMGILAVAMAVAITGCNASRKKGPQYQTATVDRASVAAKVSATGTLSALVTVQVGSQVSGRILQLNVDFNSTVKRGQLLAKIDPALFEAALEMARANVLAADGNLNKAQAQAEDARLQYSRSQQLAGKGVVTQQELDTSRSNSVAAAAQVKAVEGALAQARAALHQSELNLSYTRIVSPVDGIVVSRNVDLGQTVAAAFAAPVLFLIAEDLRKMQIDTSVSEADVGRLQDGMQATFTVDAYPGQTFQGTIRQVRNNSTTIQNVVTYDAVIDVDNSKLFFKPGMTANVTVVTAARTNVLRIPNAALRFQPALVAGGEALVAAAVPAGTLAPGNPAAAESATKPAVGGMRTVWLLKGGKLAAVQIQPGVSDGTVTEIVSGDVREGDIVVTDILGSGSASGSFRAF